MDQIQYMGFLTQYLGTATDSKGITGYLRSSKIHSPSNSKSITRILYNRYGNAHIGNYLLLIDRESKQEIEPSTVISRIRYLMEGYIDHEPTSLLKEYHIHLNAQLKEGQENPSITQYQRN